MAAAQGHALHQRLEAQEALGNAVYNGDIGNLDAALKTAKTLEIPVKEAHLISAIEVVSAEGHDTHIIARIAEHVADHAPHDNAKSALTTAAKLVVVRFEHAREALVARLNALHEEVVAGWRGRKIRAAEAIHG